MALRGDVRIRDGDCSEQGARSPGAGESGRGFPVGVTESWRGRQRDPRLFGWPMTAAGRDEAGRRSAMGVGQSEARLEGGGTLQRLDLTAGANSLRVRLDNGSIVDYG